MLSSPDAARLTAWLWNFLQPSVFVNVLLAIVGAVAAVIAVITLQAIKNQTRASVTTIRLSKRAADAAKTSADAAREALALSNLKERAYIDLSHHPPGLVVDLFTMTGADNIPRKAVRVTIGAQNRGNTRGVLTTRLVQLLFRDQPLPTDPPYDKTLAEVLRIPMMPGDTINKTFVWQVPEETLTQVALNSGELYVIGFVDYLDEFGGRHRSGYGRVYSPRERERTLFYREEAGLIQHVDDPATAQNNLPFVAEMNYNYDRPRRQDEGNDWH
jgi:hypothetical protein